MMLWKLLIIRLTPTSKMNISAEYFEQVIDELGNNLNLSWRSIKVKGQFKITMSTSFPMKKGKNK